MTLISEITRPQADRSAEALVPTGLAAGARVATSDGDLPVEFLQPGDRIVTRAGMRVLRDIRVIRYSGPAIRVSAHALGPDHPGLDMILPEAAQVLVRDWRAQAMFGQAQAMVAVAWLVDDEFIRNTDVADLQVFELCFDSPQVVYANGMEFGCGEVTPDLYTVPPAPETLAAQGR